MCIRDRRTPDDPHYAYKLSWLAALRAALVDDVAAGPVSYTHLRAHETPEHLVCRPPRSTRVRSSAASDVYKRQTHTRRPALRVQAELAGGAARRPGRRRGRRTCLLYTSPSPRDSRASRMPTTEIDTRKIVGSVRCV